VAVIQAVVRAQHAPCPKPTVAVAPREPYVTRGPTQVVVGLYVQGGALIPNCPQEPRGPDPGTVTVSAHGGRIVARETLSAAGKLFVLAVAPGNYTISAKIANGVRLRSVSVTVRAGYSVRRDLFEDVP
jgi:hypothetical protein